MEKETKLTNIELGKIIPSPRNPRKTISEAEIDELAQNIKSQGLLQPITVRPFDGGYEIVCGERRYKAVKKNAEASKSKKATIACIVREMTDEEAFEAMITENLQRKDVDPMEEAFAFCELVKTGKSVEEIADRFGKNKRFVQERIKLNSLITPLKTFTTKGVIPIAGAMMLSKLKEELQNSYFEYLEERYQRDENLIIEVREIRSWIEREFMRLESAEFLEYDENCETAPPTEDWNKGKFEKCSTCCMNTGNAGCLFYQMKGNHYCTDRDCFEKKTAAYWFSEIERLGDGRIVKDGEVPESGMVVILDDDPDVKYGYDSLNRIRKLLMKQIKDKGYMIARYDTFDGRCKYYADDKRIPALLKQGKVIECITLGSSYYIEVENEFFYINGFNSEKETPEEREARELSGKYKHEVEKMQETFRSKLRDLCDDYGMVYAKRSEQPSDEEECMFWSLILSECSISLMKEISGSCIERADEIIPYVKNNLSDENKWRWLRDYINETCRRRSSYSDIGRSIMRQLFKYAYPEKYDELSKSLSEKLEKKTAKIKERLKELGYGANGKKL